MRYQIVTSCGERVIADEADVEKVILAKASGGLAMCKRGIVNAAHLVVIVPFNENEGSNIPRSEQSERPLTDAYPELRARIVKLYDKSAFPLIPR